MPRLATVETWLWSPWEKGNAISLMPPHSLQHVNENSPWGCLMASMFPEGTANQRETITECNSAGGCGQAWPGESSSLLFSTRFKDGKTNLRQKPKLFLFFLSFFFFPRQWFISPSLSLDDLTFTCFGGTSAFSGSVTRCHVRRVLSAGVMGSSGEGPLKNVKVRPSREGKKEPRCWEINSDVCHWRRQNERHRSTKVFCFLST